MDIQKTKEERLENTCNAKGEWLEYIGGKRAAIEAAKKTLEKMEGLQDETDALKRLEEANGKEVKITSHFYREDQVDICKLDYKMEAIVLRDGYVVVPLISDNDCVLEILDAKTKTTIYKNDIREKDRSIQKAILLGKKSALKDLESREEELAIQEKWAQGLYKGADEKRVR